MIRITMTILLVLLGLYANEYNVDTCGMLRDSNNKLYQAFEKNSAYYAKTTKYEEWKRIDLLPNYKFTDYFEVDCKDFINKY